MLMVSACDDIRRREEMTTGRRRRGRRRDLNELMKKACDEKKHARLEPPLVHIFLSTATFMH